MPPEIRTRATLRSAEFGFFGVVVYTRVHTPRRCGAATFFLRPLPDLRPGVDSFLDFGVRPLRTSWLVVGMRRVMVANPRPPPWLGGECRRRGPSYSRYARAKGPRGGVGCVHAGGAARRGARQVGDHPAASGWDAASDVPQCLLDRPARAAAPRGSVARRGARLRRRRGAEPLQRCRVVELGWRI